MRKKGFTLIELLAVIVILAIIASIAIPIVINIISDTKQESELSSADFYLDALELSIAQDALDDQRVSDGVYNILENGNICLSYDENNKCKDELKVKVKGEPPKEGSVLIKNGKIDDILLKINNKIVGKNNEGEISNLDKLTDICKLKSAKVSNEITVGDKYECSVKIGNKKTFYVLEVGTNRITDSTIKENEVALILEGNYDKTTQSWCDQNGPNKGNNVCNGDGLTKKLDEISNDWTKVSREQIGLPSVAQIATAVGKAYTSNIILPRTSDWLYNWPGNEEYSSGSNAPKGYWTATPSDVYYCAWKVSYDGVVVYNQYVRDSDNIGVRPVITLKI